MTSSPGVPSRSSVAPEPVRFSMLVTLALAEHAVVGGAVLVDVDRPGIAVVAQGVGVRAAVEDVRAVGGCSQLQRVVAALAPEHVVAKAAGERVGAGAAGDLVDAAGAIEGVGADVAGQDVVVVLAVEDIRASTALELVEARAAVGFGRQAGVVDEAIA